MAEYPISEKLRQTIILGTIEVMNLSDENSPNSQVEHEFEIDGRTVIASIKITEVPKEKLYRDSSWLRNEYLVKGRTIASIANQFSITPMSIHQWLRKHGIETRPRGRFNPDNL